MIDKLKHDPVKELPYHGYMLFSALAACAYTSFLNVYLQQLGYGEMVIGLFTTIPTLLCLVFQPLLAAAADRARHPMRIMIALTLTGMAAIGAQLFWRPSTPTTGAAAVLMASHTVYLVFSGAAAALNTSVMLRHLGRHGASGRYGRLRVSFSLGFTVAGIAVGWLNTLYDRGFIAFAVAMFCVTLGIIPLLPWSEHEQAARKEAAPKPGVKELLSFRELWALVGVTFLFALTNSFCYTFLPSYFMKMEGATETAFGWCVTLRTFTEIPVLLAVGWVIGKLGLKKTLLIPALSTVLRWVLVALWPNPTMVLLTQLLHGFGFVIYNVALTRYVAESVPASVGSTVQNLVTLITVSAPSLVGGVLGGLVIETWGLGYGVYLWFLIGLSVLSALILTAMVAKEGKKA